MTRRRFGASSPRFHSSQAHSNGICRRGRKTPQAIVAGPHPAVSGMAT
ncbi:hypothetical protein [Labrys sp. ZIDIC5]|nr:hypothetical protein [Labrys sp. ZIDIC5]MDZ5449967.1 hypothetical protein [Labrys sp. ZIDIC5]